MPCENVCICNDAHAMERGILAENITTGPCGEKSTQATVSCVLLRIYGLFHNDANMCIRKQNYEHNHLCEAYALISV